MGRSFRKEQGGHPEWAVGDSEAQARALLPPFLPQNPAAAVLRRRTYGEDEPCCERRGAKRLVKPAVLLFLAVVSSCWTKDRWMDVPNL